MFLLKFPVDAAWLVRVPFTVESITSRSVENLSRLKCDKNKWYAGLKISDSDTAQLATLFECSEPELEQIIKFADEHDFRISRAEFDKNDICAYYREIER